MRQLSASYIHATIVCQRFPGIVNAHTIQAKKEKLLHKATAIKKESKLMSTVFQWLSEDETPAITSAFGGLTMVIARQLEPSIRCVRTGGNTRDASLENIVNT